MADRTEDMGNRAPRPQAAERPQPLDGLVKKNNKMGESFIKSIDKILQAEYNDYTDKNSQIWELSKCQKVILNRKIYNDWL